MDRLDLLAYWKRARSYLRPRRTWRLSDYPIRVRQTPPEQSEALGRLLPVRWVAQIVHWWGMAGHGATRSEALEQLHVNFERRREGAPLPRPGCSVQINFAPSYRIEEHPELAADFFRRIFDMDYTDVWISDESSLWDFDLEDDDLSGVYERILLAYGVDVSDIPDARLASIFERLVSRGATA